MSEQITIHGKAGGLDDDGRRLPGVADVQAVVKSVQPLNLDEVNEDDRQGVQDALRVWSQSGVKVGPGDHVTIRGLRYRVVRSAWDWGANRRPRLARHRPGVVFDCVRGVG